MFINMNFLTIILIYKLIFAIVMLKGYKIKFEAHYFVLILLSILLLSSPCSARNSMQDFAGLEKTSTLNKSKTAQTFNRCVAISKHYKEGRSKVKRVQIALTKLYFFKFSIITFSARNQNGKFDSSILYCYNHLGVPMYILYENMQTYLM